MMKWVTKPLGELATYINGRAFKPEHWKTSGLPIIRIENLNNAGAVYNYFQGEVDERYLVNDGDILVSWSASLDAYIWNRGPAILNQHIFKVEPNEELVDPDFLFFVLKRALKGLVELVHGATMQHVTRPVFEGFEVSIPTSIVHQKEIAIRLKAQFAEVDKAKQALGLLRRETRELKSIVRREAFHRLIENCGRVTSLKEVCAISAGGTPSRGNALYFIGKIPWVKTLDLNFGLVTDTQEKISGEAFTSIRGELLPAGTVMVAMYGGAGTIGKSGILGIEACTNQAVCALQPAPSVLTSEFLHEWLCYIRPEWMQHSGGNRKDPNINKSVVENMTLPLPPLEEQVNFTRSVGAALSEATALERESLNQLTEINSLPGKLLSQVFDKVNTDVS